MSKILIDAGMSSRGWSRIGTFFRCPQLFAYQRRLNMEMIPAAALTRGSMGHVMQAHQHAIWGCQQGGCHVGDDYMTDASTLLSPEDSVHAWVEQYGEGAEFIDEMVETFRRYMAKFPEAPGRIVAVEYPIMAVLGTKQGEWGLWVVHPDELDTPLDVAHFKAVDGHKIEPTPLNCPGHPDSGKAIALTRRLDLVTRDTTGRVYIWDHKHNARVQANKSTDGYAIDGGFAAFRIMGKQIWGDEFGGVMLNLIQRTPPWTVARPMVPATPHRDRHFAKMLWRAEHELARLDRDGDDFWEWPKVQNESSCVGRYGKCSGIKLCFYGEAGKY